MLIFTEYSIRYASTFLILVIAFASNYYLKQFNSNPKNRKYSILPLIILLIIIFIKDYYNLDFLLISPIVDSIVMGITIFIILYFKVLK